MSNFSVTVTEILGTDSMNNSRVTINNNFNTLATAINNISNLVSTTQIGNATTIDLQGKSATIGGVTINNGAVQIGTNGALQIGGSSLDETALAALLRLI